MTIDEAIRGLDSALDESIPTTNEERINAILLGEEALKQVLNLRKQRGLASCYLLPGETEE